MHRLANDGEHAGRLVLTLSLVVGIALGCLLPRDIPGEKRGGLSSRFQCRQGDVDVSSCDLVVWKR
jgi:hypothetical protein